MWSCLSSVASKGEKAVAKEEGINHDNINVERCICISIGVEKVCILRENVSYRIALADG